MPAIYRWLKLRLRPSIFCNRSEENYKFLAENINDVILRCNVDGTTSYVSPSSARVLGWTPADMIGKGPHHFVLHDDLQAIHEAEANHASGGENTVATFRMHHKDGSEIWVEANASKLIRNKKGDDEFVIVIRNVEERKRLEQILVTQALTDGLTGLANRRAFDQSLESEWRRIARLGGRVSLLLIDVDHFKNFNDSYGHQVGDDCLRAIARTVQMSVNRPADLAARYGGEELAVILPDTDSAGSASIAESIRRSIQSLQIPHIGNQPQEVVTVSVGTATALSSVDGSVQMPTSLLQAADTALYKAKKGGRNRTARGLILSGLEKARAA